jgi:hypothetical protein
MIMCVLTKQTSRMCLICGVLCSKDSPQFKTFIFSTKCRYCLWTSNKLPETYNVLYSEANPRYRSLELESISEFLPSLNVCMKLLSFEKC